MRLKPEIKTVRSGKISWNDEDPIDEVRRKA